MLPQAGDPAEPPDSVGAFLALAFIVVGFIAFLLECNPT
jgi:hypothetical protein